MNSIPQKQNTEKQLQRIAAQRQLYADAKAIFGYQLIICGPLAVALAFIALIYPQAKPYTGLWGLTVAALDVVWLTPWIKRLRTTAAQIQELFDCDVLELPWIEVKTGKRPDPEIIKEHADRYARWADKMPPITDWYDVQVGQLPLHIARIACQRANCWWDSNQRRRYANLVLLSVSIVCAIPIVLSIVQGPTIADFIVGVCAPLAPAIMLGVRQYKEQTEAASILDGLKNHTERLWKEALSGEGQFEISAKSRTLQNEIFDSRKRSPPLFDAVFKHLRNDYEARMNYATAELVKEAQAQAQTKFRE